MRTLVSIVMMAACGGAGPMQPVPPVQPAQPAQPPVAPAQPQPPPDLAFTLEVGGDVTTPTGAAALVATKEIHKGDAVALSIKTSKRTTIYVAYCDTEQKLAIYPPSGTQVAEAGTAVRVPPASGFIADDHRGLEHLFVIATAAQLDRSDPKLQELLAKAQGGAATPCSSELAMTTDESRALAALPPVAAPPETRPAGGSAAPVERPRIASVRAYKSTPAIWRPRGFGLPDTATTSSSSSDAAGIAIWAITLAHK
jgi:hypothetical protein